MDSRSEPRREGSRSRSKEKVKIELQQNPALPKLPKPGRPPRAPVFIKDLPKRPQRGNYQQKKREIVLTTNNFKVNFKGVSKIYIYSLKITPEIQRDNRILRRQIVSASALTQEIGRYVMSGQTIFAAQQPKDVQASLTLPVTHNLTTYEMTVKHARTIDLKDLENLDPRVHALPIKWFNILVKNFLRQMNFFEYGKTGKFYDLRKRVTVPDTRLFVLLGFQTSFSWMESGLHLRVDVNHRLVRQDTVLQIIKALYKDYHDKSRDEKRERVRDELVGSQIISNYGGNRVYVIDDILNDKDTSTFECELSDGSFITLDNYFLQKYNLTITDKKAPLIVSKGRDDRLLYLVAEFCIMSGVPKNFNEFQRKAVSKCCISEPNKRLTELSNITAQMVREEFRNDINQKQVQETFGIEILANPKQIEAKQLAPPTIRFGEGRVVNELYNGAFNSGKYTAFRCISDVVSYGVIHPYDFNINEFERAFIETNRSIGIKCEVKRFRLGENRATHQRDFDEIFKRHIAGKCQAVIVIMDRQLSKFYSAIKQMCVLTEGIISQMVTVDTLTKKNMSVIMGKVITQILYKMGGSMWCVGIPASWPRSIIVISVITIASSINKGQMIVAFCASLDFDATVIYSQVMVIEKQANRHFVPKIDEMTEGAFKAYFQRNKSWPDMMLYFREGLDEEAIAHLLSDELPLMLAKGNQLNPQFNSKAIVATLQKSQIQRFFTKRDSNRLMTMEDEFVNPPFGTVVDSNVVSINYEFYMISQHATRGSVSPTLYRIIHDSIGMPKELLQDYIFSQCFNYANWSGAIRVPAIVQFAIKLAKFIGENIGKEPKSSLQMYLYYL